MSKREEILKSLFEFIGTKTRDAQIKEVDEKGLWGADLVDSNNLIADWHISEQRKLLKEIKNRAERCDKCPNESTPMCPGDFDCHDDFIDKKLELLKEK